VATAEPPRCDVVLQTTQPVTQEATHRKMQASEVKKRIGYVRQQDYLVDCLTVRETLTFVRLCLFLECRMVILSP
jgi:ABC-type multidrug transport system ATPase subunit